jgi:radical SAM/Cys-rich protein
LNSFDSVIRKIHPHGLVAGSIRTVQVNLGLRCNLECAHCHIGANSSREEVMSRETMRLLLDKTSDRPEVAFDLTGGSPELNPYLRFLVESLTARKTPVQVRTNLVALLDSERNDLPRFYRDHGVSLAASLPCYREENVRIQRGGGVYEGSIRALGLLNALGYGIDPALPLGLVYNPGGPFLPPDQIELEEAYRMELGSRFGIRFTRLLTIANMPLGRFRFSLARDGKLKTYESLLRQSFNPDTLSGLMCREQVSVGWDGRLSDCDFNLALGIPLGCGAPVQLRDFSWEKMEKRGIVTGEHCFGCTAGCGSSCSGAVISGDSLRTDALTLRAI